MMFWNRHKQSAEHYKALFDRYYNESCRYQALLFHSWRVIREQNKGLNRQARKIKRLQKALREPGGEGG